MRDRVKKTDDVSTDTHIVPDVTAEVNAQLQREIGERKQAEAERDHLLAAERTQTRRQAALFRLSAELAAILEESEVCQRVVDGLHDTLGYDHVALFLVDETAGDRVLAASVGYVEPPTPVPPGQGLSEYPLLNGQLHYTPDVTQDSRYFYGMWGSEVDVPIPIGEKVLGVLTAESRQPYAFDQEDFDMLTAAAQQAGLAIEKARLLAAERQRADELDALRTTMADITAELELSTLLQAIVERAAGLLNATGGELGLYDEASQEIQIVVSYNLSEDYVGTRHALGEGAMGRVAETREPLIIKDYHTWEGGLPQYPHIHATLAAPLEVGGRLVGVFTTVATDPGRQFGPADLHLLNLFAQQAAIAIENARLYDQAQREIAERKRFEEEIRRQKEYFEALFVNNPVAVVTSDLDGHVVSWNPIAEKLFGYIEEEAIGRSLDDLVANNDSIRAEAAGYTDQVLHLGRVGVTTKRTRRDGSLVDVELLALPVIVAGEKVGFIAIYHDITERKRAEAELRRYQDHLEELVGERTAELRKSEERYRTLFDGLPVGLYRTTPAGEIVDSNMAIVQMLGYPSREDLLTINAIDLYANPQDRVQWKELMAQEGVVRDFEIQFRRYDGTVIWVKNTARALTEDAGQVLYYEGSVEDITERKRAEAELREYQEHLEELVEERTAELQESEERYRTLFDGVPVGLYRTTPAGQIVDANLAMVQMMGYPSREDLLAINTASLYVDPEERLRWKALMEREGLVRDFEVQGHRYDGTLVWVSDTARAVKDEQGQVLHYEGSLEDITERKGFEEEIRRQKEYFEALFVNSPVAALTADLDANVVSWNPMAEKLFGYPQEDAIGQNVDELVAKDPRVREEALNYTRQAFTEGRVQATTQRTRKDGSLVDVEVVALPVIVAGEMVEYIAIYHDITELQRARRAAEAANRAKSTFLANMSHELRTPLNAILGFTQLMDRDPNLTPEQQENLGIINRSGEHLLALINDVLEMSKIEAGKVTLQERSFDLYRLLDILEEMFRLRAEGKGLTLSFERAETVPEYVVADEGKLRQVLMNVLGNAVKFTEEGSVTLRVKAVSPAVRSLPKRGEGLLGEGGRLVFEVEDTGPGIAPGELEAVFEPFVQATRGQQPQEGTGLGLSISRQFVRLMGGDITVSSVLGRGSVFRFEVPIGLVAAAKVQAARPSRQVLGLEPGQAVYRLLIADDRQASRQLLIKLLEPLGFEVREAINGREAIEMWERWEPHLIWMDMRMPVIDGYEAARRIKATPKGQATAIVALTATAFAEDRETILSAGCDDVVRKPFRQDEIFGVLVKHLGVRFVYEEQAQATVVELADAQEVLTPAALAALPSDWLADLQQVTVKADLTLILTLIDQIRQRNEALADALADLADDFEYKKILTLIQQARGR